MHTSINDILDCTPGYCAACGTIVQTTPADDDHVRCTVCSAMLPGRDGRDVFISYSTADLESTTALARTLAQRGIGFWLAPVQIQPSESFLSAIAEAIPQVRVMVFLLSEHSIHSPWVVREAVMGISQQISVFAVRLGEVALTPKWQLMLTDTQWDSAGPMLTDADLARLAKLISKRLAPASAATLLGEPTTREKVQARGVDPRSLVYVGPQPFPEGMETRFFGREDELRHLIELLSDSSVLLTSPSGAGKSSLLAAGLVPVLRRAGHQVLSKVRIGRSLPAGLGADAGPIRNAFAFSLIHELEGLAMPARRDMTVADALAALPPPDPGKLRVLVLDQFEEVFTQHTDRWEEREPFMAQLSEALKADPNLRIVYAMRQEYLADFQILVERTPTDFRPARFQLRRMQREALTDVIRRPAEAFAEFSDETVDAILGQLTTIRVQQPDGSFIEKPGEFVELVHLQIVCSRLWNSLPAGLTRIETTHLARAAADVSGQDFGSFVKNALDVFYNDVVTRVSGSAETARHGGFSAELIKLGCMKFVSQEGTRQPMQEGKELTGRLPNWIVKQLADHYLLRTETVGVDRWFELSHDLLACAVVRDMNPRVSELLFASDRLEKELRRLREKRGDTLDGYFEGRRELLEACRPFQQSTGLYAGEAEFLFRSCVACGFELAAWSARVRADHAAVHRAVIIDALGSKDADVRANAIGLISADDDRELHQLLVRVGLGDPEASVRRAAAAALLELDDPGLFAMVLDAIESPTDGKRAQRLAALMLAMADVRPASRFDRSFRGLPSGQRRSIRRQAWRTRFVDALPLLPYTLIPTGVFGAIAAGLYKWIPGSFNLALVQEGPGAGMGFFHGVTAGFLWGGIIPMFLAIHRLVFWNARGRASVLRPVGNIVWGLLGAAVSSAIIVAIILSVYSLNSLKAMDWISAATTERASATFLADAFLHTRMGWAHIVLGLAMGVGMAMTTNALRARGQWDRYLAGVEAPSTLRGMTKLVRDIARIVIRHAWPIPVALLVGSVIVCLISNPAPNNPVKMNVIPGLVGDASTQLVGSVAAIVGLGVGIVILRRGLAIAPKTNIT